MANGKITFRNGVNKYFKIGEREKILLDEKNHELNK